MSDKPQLYLFLSVDIIGSTAKKYDTKNPIDWYGVFSDFYVSFPEEFRVNLKLEYEYNRKMGYSRDNLVIWKHAGDEILFYAEITQENEVPCVVYAFKKTLEDWYSAEDKLDVKGCVWTGQVPFIDRKLGEENCGLDFIGPSIDCGFRLGKYASKNEIAISVEVADLLNGISRLQSSLYYLKSENLKGVFGEKKYPIFVLKLDGVKTDEYDFLKNPCQKTTLDDFIKRHYEGIEEDFKGKASRIKKDIPSYLAEKKEACKQIATSKTAGQKDAREIDKRKKDDNTEFEKFEALFTPVTDSV